MAGIGLAMGLFGTGLGALGQPQLLNRIMAVRTNRERKQAAAITIGWGVIIYSGLICLAFRRTGVAGRDGWGKLCSLPPRKPTSRRSWRAS